MHHHPDKGKQDGRCNRSACQREGAFYYNRAMLTYYCWPCACEINKHSSEDYELFPDLTYDVEKEEKLRIEQQERKKRSLETKKKLDANPASLILKEYTGLTMLEHIEAAIPSKKREQRPPNEQDVQRMLQAQAKRDRRNKKRLEKSA